MTLVLLLLRRKRSSVFSLRACGKDANFRARSTSAGVDHCLRISSANAPSPSAESIELAFWSWCSWRGESGVCQRWWQCGLRFLSRGQLFCSGGECASDWCSFAASALEPATGMSTSSSLFLQNLFLTSFVILVVLLDESENKQNQQAERLLSLGGAQEIWTRSCSMHLDRWINCCICHILVVSLLPPPPAFLFALNCLFRELLQLNPEQEMKGVSVSRFSLHWTAFSENCCN